MINFLKLIRWPNLLVIAVAQYFMRYFVIYPVLKINGYELHMSAFDFFLLVFSTLLLAAAGYIINDYFDHKIDLTNRPDRIIVGKKIQRRKALLFHLLLNGIAVLIGIYLAWTVKLFFFAFINLVAVGIFWYYSTTYKRMFLVGNLTVATLTALPSFGVVLFELLLLYQKSGVRIAEEGLSFTNLFVIVGAFSGFAFITNLTREFIKDLEDLEGDHLYGRRTLPVVTGIKTTQWITFSILILTCIAVISIYVNYILDPISLWYFVVFLILPMLLLAIMVVRAKTREHFHTASNLLKVIMIMGIFYAPLIYYIILYKIPF